MPSSIVWFRNDLRLADNPALVAGLGSGHPVVPVYVLDEETEGHAPAGRSRATEPGAFWVLIAMQAIFPNAAILYLLWFATSSS